MRQNEEISEYPPGLPVRTGDAHLLRTGRGRDLPREQCVTGFGDHNRLPGHGCPGNGDLTDFRNVSSRRHDLRSDCDNNYNYNYNYNGRRSSPCGGDNGALLPCGDALLR